MRPPLRVANAQMPGTQVWALREGVALEVEVTRTAPAIPNSAAVQAEWDSLCAANPRLFDGALLSVLHIEHANDATRIHARPDRFARLAVQPKVATGVRILSVTAICTATREDGSLHVLLGRRARDTRIYGGMWELGPSGGLGVPPPSLRTLDVGAVWSHLADEVQEEVGVDAPAGRAIAITRDQVAMSDDVVFHCDLGAFAEAHAATRAANWEYEDVRWLDVREVAAFDREHGDAIIVPTRALFRALGWAS